MARGSHPFDSARLQRERMARGLSLEKLACCTGISKSQLADYESGRSVPEPQRLRQLARGLGVAALELMGRTVSSATLPDLRAAAGLTAREMAARLHVSPAVYRRLEHEGRFWDDRFAILTTLADTFCVDVDVVSHAVERAPGFLQRRMAMMASAVDISQQLWARRQNPVLSAGDPRLAALCADSASRPHLVRGVVNCLLAQGRSHLMDQINYRGQADYAAEGKAREQADACAAVFTAALTNWPYTLVDSVEWLDAALSAREWSVLNCFACPSGDMGPRVHDWVFGSRRLTRQASVCPGVTPVLQYRMSPTGLLLEDGGSSGARLRLTAWGMRYWQVSEQLYRSLYPRA
ncbi:helix-turn-helix domain-containing protein [Yinghuangia aomiensis]